MHVHHGTCNASEHYELQIDTRPRQQEYKADCLEQKSPSVGFLLSSLQGAPLPPCSPEELLQAPLAEYGKSSSKVNPSIVS